MAGLEAGIETGPWGVFRFCEKTRHHPAPRVVIPAMKRLLALPALLLPLTALSQNVKPIPPPGVEVPAADRTEIETGVKQLGEAIAALRKNPGNAAELPNVEIYHKAADWALRYNEIFNPKQIATAKDHLKRGLERAAALAKGETPWNAQTGLVARGYRSKIDGSVQPYGLLVPDDFKPGEKHAPFRLDFWCHGRGENLSELAFIEGVQKNKGEFTPEGAILCQLYGRFCCANKFAGEMDLFEALDDIKTHYPIDEERLVVRGFSMGGASCWQFATHHSGMWAAAAPGAGFAETAEFFHSLAPGKEPPPKWEQTLWHWYDCTTMAANLANTTPVAYSGEIDGQKQAADIMIKYAEKEGITIPHIIGPQTGHKYHPDAKPKINELVDTAVSKGNDPFPRKVRLSTYTLIYPKAEWVSIFGMEKEWEQATVTAEVNDQGEVTVTTKNVTRLALNFPKLPPAVKSVTVDGVALAKGTGPLATFVAEKSAGKWMRGPLERTGPESAKLRKTPAQCGPIDHAFMSRFVFVRPTGKPLNDTVGAWAKSEMEHAVAQWRRVFRGDVEIVDDTKLSDEQIKNANLVLWGDPSSNKAFARVAAKLPLKWDARNLTLGTQSVDAATHAPILIYPNPLSPGRYVVLNSGFTFREFAALNNSDQTPKLPDWAVVDLTTPPGPKWPGKIVDAGFFDEQWQVPK
jgi:pimeloyl-ACP methyl ester carboxylesterase